MTKRYKLMKPSINKYKFTGHTMQYQGRTLYRIQALRSFNDVKVGDLGGWVESYNNLSQFDDAWIYDEAKVYDNAKIYDNAKVQDYAIVSGNAQIYNFANISDKAQISHKARIYDRAHVYNYAQISGMAKIYGKAQIYGFAKIYGEARVNWESKVYNDAQVYDQAYISRTAEIYGKAKIYENAEITDEAKVYGHSTEIFGNAIISGNAIVEFNKDYMVLKNNWSNNEYFTYTHSNKQYVVEGFNYTATELIEKAYEESQLNGDCYKNMVESVERLYTIFENQN